MPLITDLRANVPFKGKVFFIIVIQILRPKIIGSSFFCEMSCWVQRIMFSLNRAIKNN